MRFLEKDCPKKRNNGKSLRPLNIITFPDMFVSVTEGLLYSKHKKTANGYIILFITSSLYKLFCWEAGDR